MSALGNRAQALAALQSIPSNLPRAEWHQVGRAAIAAGIAIDAIVEWSRGADNFKSDQDVRSAFKNIAPDGGTGPGTLFKTARKHGHYGGKNFVKAPTGKKPEQSTNTYSFNTPPKLSAQDIWNLCDSATESHSYIADKNAFGVPLENLRVLPIDSHLRIAGERMAGALVVPIIRADETLSTLQFIVARDTAHRLRSAGKPTKLNLPGGQVDGWHTVGKLVPDGIAYVCEGIGQAWAVWQATGAAAVVCFGSGNMEKVVSALRECNLVASLVLVPDSGKESEAEAIARKHHCSVACMPTGELTNFDVCDFAKRDGLDALEVLLHSACNPSPLPLPLSVAFASTLSEDFAPPDEIVEGLLTAEDGSVIYGDSNSGKTFLVIDVACAIARGITWMGRRTEQGLVIYLAAESPASVRARLQAYQSHHGVRVQNFAIVQNAIDLFDGDGDTVKVIQTVRQLEAQCGQKVRLIVGDTLARLSAGANENAGQDMGLIIQRFDRIRKECKAHFCLIHHSGKAAAAGARGWSGIRAAVDTEIEVTETTNGRCCEVMKQRDLASKGIRIGFTLNQVTLGLTKWGAPATSCVVIPSDAPQKNAAKRVSECDGAVLEFLKSHKVGILKSLVVKHFESRYAKGPIYRSMKALVAAQAIHEAAGMVAISIASK